MRRRRNRFRALISILFMVIPTFILIFYNGGLMALLTTSLGHSSEKELACFSLYISSKVQEKKKKKPPHIIFILADDLGFNDIGYHNPRIKTPIIDNLAREGVRLENYYVQPICSPTRSQLMVGRYQIRYGQQHGLFWPAQPLCLPLNEVTIAQKLKEVGYKTHIVGKWHLGFYRKECTPLYRGFDSFYGFLSGGQDHVFHNSSNGFPPSDSFQYMVGYDFWRNEIVDFEATGKYSTTLFANEAEKIIQNHDLESPLFLYLPFQAVHDPLQVPEKYLVQYKDIKDKRRRIYSGMVSCMDEAIGNITNSLKQKGMWENTLLIFSSDNGGFPQHGGNNWPLRGTKWTFWEGGIRGVGFVSGPLISNPGCVNRDLIHVADWFPTLVKLAGGNLTGTLPLDGIDQWETISTGKPTGRMDILHGIDPTEDWVYPRSKYKYCQQGVIRVGDWKLIIGCPGEGTSTADPSSWSRNRVPPKDWSTKKVFLFNIETDPEENYDLSDKYPKKVDELLARLEVYRRTSVPVVYPDPDSRADPSLHGSVWRPWIDISTHERHSSRDTQS